MTHNWQAVIRFLLIAGLGAIPATYYGYWAGPMALMGGVFFGVFSVSGLAVLAWGVAIIAGTISLWFASFGRTTAVVAIGLILGMIAIAPFTYHTLMREPTMNSAYGQFAFVSPFLVSIYILIEYSVSKFRSISGPNDSDNVVSR